jgi:hypothetical protein
MMKNITNIIYAITVIVVGAVCVFSDSVENEISNPGSFSNLALYHSALNEGISPIANGRLANPGEKPFLYELDTGKFGSALNAVALMPDSFWVLASGLLGFVSVKKRRHIKVSTKDKTRNIILAAVALIGIVVVAPFLILNSIVSSLNGLWLNCQFRSRWGPAGKHILFVYSESRYWQEYIEGNIVPSIKNKAVFLNESKRSEWEKSMPLEAKALLHWGGDSEFNPIAIVFASSGKVKTINFYKAFEDLDQGKNKLLKEKEAELYEYL